MKGRGRERRLFGVRILHEDPDVIVVEKAAGVLSQATRRDEGRDVESVLSDYVRKGQWKSRARVYLVHRLDRETAGVMMVAKSETVQERFRNAWGEMTKKVYLAGVEGTLSATSGAFEGYLREDENMYMRLSHDPSQGKFARTEWRLVAQDRDSALAEATLKTGRKNQIRVQFAAAGHPVVGDSKYGHGRKGQALQLLAWRLSFIHPHSGEWMTFEASLPQWVGKYLPKGVGMEALT